MKRRTLFKLFTSVLFLMTMLLVITGCATVSTQLSVKISDDADLHEGKALPDLIMLSDNRGTLSWEDEDGVLLPGLNKYIYIYTDSLTGEQTKKEISITATAHELAEDLQVIKEPTCIEEGIKSEVCTICQATFHPESIKKLDHEYLSEHVEGTCITKALTYHKCKMCEQYEVDAEGEKVFELGEYGKHVYKTDAQGNEIIETTDNIIPPTCTVEGKGYVYCTLDDTADHSHKKLVSIPVVEHEYTTEVHTDVDCQHYGYTEYYCKHGCGEVLLEEDGVTTVKTYDLVKGAHSFDDSKHTDGDCVTYGYTEYICTVQGCGEYKMTEDGTETFKTYDTVYGAHEYYTDEHGNYIIETSEPVIPATCQADGSGYVYCKLDNTPDHSHKKPVTIPKTDHEYTTEVHTDVDCQHYGYTEYYCKHGCGEVLLEEDGVTTVKTYDLVKGAHSFDDSKHTDGNCVTYGYTEYICTVQGCGEYKMTEDGTETFKTYDTVYGAHKYNTDEHGNEIIEEGEPIIPPTCQADGSGYVYCIYDNTLEHTHKKPVTISKVDHEYTTEVHTDVDCQHYGYTEFFCKHNCGTVKLEEDGVTTYKEYDLVKGAHNFSDSKHTDGDCVTYGYTEYICSVLGCGEFKMTEDGTETFKTYDTVYGAHEYYTDEQGNYIIATTEPMIPATCQADGSGYVYCKHDNTPDHSHKKPVTIPKTDHEYTTEVHTDVDCQHYGYTEFYCKHNCGEVLLEDDGVTTVKEYDDEKGAHNFSNSKHTDGNCVTYGYTEYICSVCGEYKMTEDGSETFKEYDPELGEHKYRTDEDGNYVIEESEIVKPASCKEEGSGYVYCIYDETPDHSHKKLVTIPKTDHDYSDIVKLGGEDCLHQFYNEKHCIYCDTPLMDNEKDPPETWKEYLEEVGPHTFVNGICILCGELDTIQRIWYFGPKDAAGYEVDDGTYGGLGYTNAVVAYLIARPDNVPGGVVYYDLVIRPAEGYVGPMHNATGTFELPWNEQFGVSVTNVYSKYIKTVTVCEGITTISDYMCQDMTALQDVFLPDSMESHAQGKARSASSSSVSLGKHTFENCINLEEVHNIPDTLTHIGEFCFNNCEKLSTFTFPSTLKNIDRESFRYCDSLDSVDLSNCAGLETIGYNAFEFCPFNSYVVLPNDHISFGSMAGTSMAFNGIYHEIIFVMGDGDETHSIPNFDGAEIIFIGEGKRVEDVLVRDQSGIYYIDTKINPIKINSFTDVDNEDEVVRGTTGLNNAGGDQIFTTFNYNDGLVIVYSAIQVNDDKYEAFFDSHDNVVRIGSYAFADSDGLTSVAIPDSVKDIGAFAFDNCNNLTNITINSTSSVESIAANAFGKTKISSIYLPKSLKLMGTSALSNLALLEEVTFDCGKFDRRRAGENTIYTYGNADPSILYHTNTTKDVKVIIGENATVVGNSAFRGASKVTVVDFTNAKALTELKDVSFYMTGVTTIDLSGAILLNKVGDEVFAGCDNLVSVTLNDIINAWGKNAFNGKEIMELTPFTDPVTGAIYEAFNGLNYYRLVSIPEGTTEFVMNDGTVQIADGAFDNAKATLTKVTLSNGLTILPGDLFNGFSELTEITIPNTIKSFGAKLFFDCAKLETVKYKGDIADWLEISFYNDNPPSNPLYNGASLCLYNQATDSYEEVTEIIVPASVTQINSVAFAGSNITKLDFEEGSVCVSIGSYAFQNCLSLTEITLPESLKTLEEYAFYNTKALTKINYNAISLNDLSNSYPNYNHVFTSSGQTNGMDVVFGENVTVIPQALFYPGDGSGKYPKLLSIKFLGDKVTRIGDRAFYAHSSLTKAYIKSMDAWFNINFDFGEVEWGKPITDRTGTNYVYSKNDIHPLKNVTELYVWDETAGDYVAIDTLTITGNVKRYAIINCPAIKTVVIEDSATLARHSIFYSASSTVNLFVESDTALDIYGTLDWEPENTPGKGMILQKDWCYIEGAVHAHVWDAGQAIDPEHEVTCTEDGLYLYTCTDAGCDNVTKQETIKALGHNYGEFVEETAATCTEDGEKGHYYCDACEKYFDAEYNEIDNLVITALGHDVNKDDWATNETHHFHACSRCDYVEDSAEHTLGEVIRTEEASCTDYGYAVYQCSDCQKEIKVKNAEMGSHNYVPEWIDGKEASCTQTGVAKQLCDKCGDSYTEFVLPTHNFVDNVCTCGAVKADITYTYDDTAKTATIKTIENASTATYLEIPYSVKHTPEGGEEADYKVIITKSIVSTTTTKSKITYIYVDAEDIPASTFASFTAAKTLYLGANVKTLGTKAFDSMTSATELFIDSVAINANTTSTLAFYKFGNTAGVALYVGEDVVSIPDYLFYASSSTYKANITSVKFVGESKLSTIGMYSFRYTTITSVNIPNGVTEIGDYAFYYCNKMTEVTIPESVTYIGKYAFGYCSVLATVNMYCKNTTIGSSVFSSTSKITKVNIASVSDWLTISFSSYSNNPVSIAKKLYLNGVELTELVIPEGTTAIGNYAFYGADNIQTIVIPDSVITIGESAFYNNTSATSVAIGTGVTSIGTNAFYGDKALTGVYIKDLAKWCVIAFGNVNAQPLQYAKNLYVNGVLVTDLVISGDITGIAPFAFKGSTTIQTVTIGKNVVEIDPRAFSGCSGITSVTVEEGNSYFISKNNCIINPATETLVVGFACSTIPSDGSVKIIGEAAFYSCYGLTEIVIPEGITTISPYAFYDCYQVTKVYIPGSVTSRGEYAFYYCDGLESLYVADLAKWCAVEISNEAATPMYYAKNMYVYNGVEYELLTDLVIPSNVTTIAAGAFIGVSVNSVTLPANLTSIGEMAFYGASIKIIYNYSSNIVVTLGSTTNGYIGNSAVAAYNLASEDTLITENGYKFLKTADAKYTLVEYVGSETELTLSTTVEGSSVNYEIGSGAFTMFAITKASIPANVTKIGANAFYGCTALEEVTIAEGVTEIGDYAFYRCFSLASVNIPASVKTIGAYAFAFKSGDSTALATVTFAENSNLETIGNYAFNYCTALTEITIPANVTKIGTKAFNYCTGLTVINYNAKELTTALSSSSTLFYKAGQSGAGITVNIGKDVKVIPAYLFHNTGTSYATKIISVNFAENSILETIGNYAFYYCTSLKEIHIPASVKTIGTYAFRYCTALEKVVFEQGSLCTSFGTYAFGNCTSLKEVVVPATTIGSNAFSSCNAVTSVYYYGSAAITNGPSKGTKYYYSETEPSENVGTYWHYVEGVPTVWVASV